MLWSINVFHQDLPMKTVVSKPRTKQDIVGSSDEDRPLDDDHQTGEMDSTKEWSDDDMEYPTVLNEEKISKPIQSTLQFFVFLG